MGLAINPITGKLDLTGPGSGGTPDAHADSHGVGSGDPITIAQSQVTNLTTDLAAKVPAARTINGQPLTSNVTLAKGDVGLGNVDNTSDASKPISTLTQAALNAKEPIQTTASLSYAASITTNASTIGRRAELIMAAMSGNVTLNVPTSGQSPQQITYLFTASGGAERTLTLHSSLKVPDSITFTGAIPSGKTRLLTLFYTGSVWLVIKNLQFAA